MERLPRTHPAPHLLMNPLRTLSSRWVSWRPRVSILDNFLSAAECSALRTLAHPRLSRTLIEDDREDAMRTSTGVWIPPGHLGGAWGSSPASEDARRLVESIEQRVAHASGIHVSHGEPGQVLRYRVGDVRSNTLPLGYPLAALTSLCPR